MGRLMPPATGRWPDSRRRWAVRTKARARREMVGGSCGDLTIDVIERQLVTATSGDGNQSACYVRRDLLPVLFIMADISGGHIHGRCELGL